MFRTVADMTYTSETPLVWSTVSTGPARDIINDWERLRRRPATLRQVNTWAFLPHPVTDLDEVLELAGFGRAIDDADGDAFLWHLVKEAETNELATRIVLHRILPALMAIAKRRGHVVHGGVESAMVDVLGTAWFVIRQYPYHRRHHKVAANLVRDTEYHAFVRHHRLRHVDESQVGDEVLYRLADLNTGGDSPTYVSMLTDAEQMGVADQHVALLHAFADGSDSTEVAQKLGISTRTVRNYKRKAVHAVKEAYAEVEGV